MSRLNILDGVAEYGLAATIIAVATGAFTWLFRGWVRVDSRSDALFKQYETLNALRVAEITTLNLAVARLSAEREDDQKLLRQQQDKIQHLENEANAFRKEREADLKKRAVNLSVITLLFRAVERHDPGAPELVEAKTMLTRAYGIDPNTPDDMLAMLEEIDVAKSKGRRK